MTTKAEAIAALKREHLTLRVGDDEQGYTDLEPADYEAKISEWADNLIATETKEAQELAKKESAQAKLAALGLTADDLKALGLGVN